jgi:hypothetical protein
MRTTITLDDDVAAKLQAKARKSGRPFKQVVNDALRTGLALEQHAKRLPPFTIQSHQLLRLKPGFNYDKVEEIFDQLDTPLRLR